MYKTILVPLDGSDRAERILPHVDHIARQNQSSLVFMHVLVPIYAYSAHGDPYIDPKLIEQGRNQMTNYLANLKDTFIEKGFDADYVLRNGNPVREIAQVADAREADLIAIASHGRTGLARVFLGSIAAGVLHQTDKPLLLIRTAAE